MLASSDSSAMRAARLADRTDTNVATARMSVPPAVANDAAVDQSDMPSSVRSRRRVLDSSVALALARLAAVYAPNPFRRR